MYHPYRHRLRVISDSVTALITVFLPPPHPLYHLWVVSFVYMFWCRGCIVDESRKLTGLQLIFPGLILFYVEVNCTVL
jgi:hypothetical protein